VARSSRIFFSGEVGAQRRSCLLTHSGGGGSAGSCGLTGRSATIAFRIRSASPKSTTTRGVVRGCGSEELGYVPDEEAEVRSVEGIDPAIAVAASTKDSSESFVWLAPGFLVESPRHPLHAAIAKNWGLDGHEDYTCGGRLMTRARCSRPSSQVSPWKSKQRITRWNPSWLHPEISVWS
jgi:hypothetical protein